MIINMSARPRTSGSGGICSRETGRTSKADTRIETLHFKFAEIFFGPSVLLGSDAADGHIYRLIKTEKIKGQPAAVIDCGPRGIGGERPLSRESLGPHRGRRRPEDRMGSEDLRP